jgi:hypothetical protein
MRTALPRPVSNAIPREASATIVIQTARREEVTSLIATVEAHVQSELGAFEKIPNRLADQ